MRMVAPVTRGVSESWRSACQGLSITLVGLMLAGGLGLTGHAVGSLAAGPEGVGAAERPFRASTAETLMAVPPAAYGTGRGDQGASAGQEADTGTGSFSGTAGAGQGPEGSAAVPPPPAAPLSEPEEYLDTDVAVAAREEQGTPAPDFDRAMTGLSAQQRADGQSIRAGQALDEDNRLHQDVRVEAQAREAEGIAAEQGRLEEEKRRAEEEARLLAEQAALAGGDLAAEALGGADPRGTLLRGLQVPPATSTGRVGSLSQGTLPTMAPIRPGSYSIAARFGAVGTWSLYHTGVDLGAPIGTPVRAVSDGVVTVPVAGEWAGIHVIIDHGDGSTLSAHLMSSIVVPGQFVEAGDVVGFVGMTGRTFGPHLHFEYYPPGAGQASPYGARDPISWLARRGIWL